VPLLRIQSPFNKEDGMVEKGIYIQLLCDAENSSYLFIYLHFYALLLPEQLQEMHSEGVFTELLFPA
jgi:hypothetical protein